MLVIGSWSNVFLEMVGCIRQDLEESKRLRLLLGMELRLALLRLEDHIISVSISILFLGRHSWLVLIVRREVEIVSGRLEGRLLNLFIGSYVYLRMFFRVFINLVIQLLILVIVIVLFLPNRYIIVVSVQVYAYIHIAVPIVLTLSRLEASVSLISIYFFICFFSKHVILIQVHIDIVF
jgi:hypothetical protein